MTLGRRPGCADINLRKAYVIKKDIKTCSLMACPWYAACICNETSINIAVRLSLTSDTKFIDRARVLGIVPKVSTYRSIEISIYIIVANVIFMLKMKETLNLPYYISRYRDRVDRYFLGIDFAWNPIMDINRYQIIPCIQWPSWLLFFRFSCRTLMVSPIIWVSRAERQKHPEGA